MEDHAERAGIPGVLREDAYQWVQRNAMKRWMAGEDFRTNVEKDPNIARYLTKEKIEGYFSYDSLINIHH